jgi:hypothetical protein
MRKAPGECHTRCPRVVLLDASDSYTDMVNFFRSVGLTKLHLLKPFLLPEIFSCRNPFSILNGGTKTLLQRTLKKPNNFVMPDSDDPEILRKHIAKLKQQLADFQREVKDEIAQIEASPANKRNGDQEKLGASPPN